MTEREKLQEELIEELDHYYLSKTIPTLDELAKVEELKSQLAELKEESIAKTETDTGHLIDMPELEKPSGADIAARSSACEHRISHQSPSAIPVGISIERGALSPLFLTAPPIKSPISYQPESLV